MSCFGRGLGWVGNLTWVYGGGGGVPCVVGPELWEVVAVEHACQEEEGSAGVIKRSKVLMDVCGVHVEARIGGNEVGVAE